MFSSVFNLCWNDLIYVASHRIYVAIICVFWSIWMVIKWKFHRIHCEVKLCVGHSRGCFVFAGTFVDCPDTLTRMAN